MKNKIKISEIEKLKKLQQDAHAIYNNIEWNLGGLIGIASITLNPKLINISVAPMKITVEGLDLDGFQCLGVALIEKDRKPRVDELLAMGKRVLVCESLEMAADFLVRASRIITSGSDPYEIDNFFNVDIKELWNFNQGKAGSLIEKEDGNFFEKCVAPLRNFIRHNNGQLPPKKSIVYEGFLRTKKIDLRLIWKEGEDNNIKLPLSTAYDIFTIIRSIVDDGLQNCIY